jgi:hypothetical protein
MTHRDKLKKLIGYAHICTINFPVFRFGMKCKHCNRVPYERFDWEFMRSHKQVCMQCYDNTFYTYDIPRHSQVVCKKRENVSEKNVLKLLRCLEQHILGFSYECIHKCKKCKKWAIDLEEKKFIEKEKKCHECVGLIPSTTAVKFKLGKRKGKGKSKQPVNKKSKPVNKSKPPVKRKKNKK